jgi:disulfide bond formation protein DsbB
MIGAIIFKKITPYLATNEALVWMTNEKWFFCILLGIGLIGSILGTYMTRPTAKSVLDNFYKKTLPIGLWAPLKNRLPQETRIKVEKEHINDMIALPCVMCWMITMFMLPMQAIIGTWGAFKITAVVFVLSLIGMYFFWYSKLPKQNFYEDDEVQLNEE